MFIYDSVETFWPIGKNVFACVRCEVKCVVDDVGPVVVNSVDAVSLDPGNFDGVAEVIEFDNSKSPFVVCSYRRSLEIQCLLLVFTPIT